MNNNDRMLVEILARLRYQDQLRETELAGVANTDPQQLEEKSIQREQKSQQHIKAIATQIEAEFGLNG